MSCVNKNCSIKSNSERMLSCWLCDDICHIKCAGIVARVADCLTEDRGIRWCCTKCRKIEISFYRFFKSMQSEFSEMERDLSVLTYRFSKFTKMFAEFPDLEKCINSPSQSSPKRKKSSKITIPPININSSPCLMEVNTPVSVSGNSVIQTDSGVVAPSVTPGANDNILAPAILSVSKIVASSLSVGADKSTSSLVQAGDNGSNVAASNNSVVVDLMRPCSSGSQTRELTVIPVRRSVFISRFSPETTVDDINFYLSSRLDNTSSIACYKLNSSLSEKLASFKLFVPDNLFKKLVNSNFWPTGALVKEFVHRDNVRRSNLASLPKSVNSASKN